MSANSGDHRNPGSFTSTHRGFRAKKDHSPWAIVLAGGEGMRMSPLLRSCLGTHYPKQYCTYTGSRSMYQHTLDRAGSIVPKDQIVSVVGQGHRRFIPGEVNSMVARMVFEQPCDQGTAPGVLLPLAYVLSKNLDATVLILPSDHFVLTEARFCTQMDRALKLAESNRERIVLVGAIPNRTESEYDWIDPGTAPVDGSGGRAPWPGEPTYLSAKPSSEEALALLRRGCLWNTMIVAAKARTLWYLGRRFLPSMMVYFDAFLTVLRTIREKSLAPSWEEKALDALYDSISPADFSTDLLHYASRQSMVLRMEGVYWSDWGHPQQVIDTLALLGRRPIVDPKYLAPVGLSAMMEREGSALYG